MQLLKQSTASTVYVGPVLDSAGAAVTTAVVGDFRLIKNGTAATLSGATVTHDANGYYTVALTTTNTDTTGRLTLAVGNTAMSMSTHRYSVLLASVYDALITNATNATGGLPTATGAISGLAGTIATTTNITAATGIVLSGVTHTGAVIPTVSSVTNGVTVTTNNDKTGYSLTQSFPSNFASMSLDVSGRVLLQPTQTGVTIPTVTSVTDGVTASTVSDKTGYSLTAGTGLGNQTANITGNISGSVGSVTGNVGGSVASVTNAVTVGTLDAGVITFNAFETDAINLNAIDAAVYAAIANAVAATQALSRLDSMIESDGAGQFRFDTIALSMGAGGGGGTDWTANERTAIRSILGIPTSGTTPTDPTVGILDEIRDTVGSIGLNVYPVSASTPERVSGTTLTFYLDESRSVSIVTDFTLTSMTLEFTVEDSRGNDVYVVADGSITKSSQTATVPITSTVTGSLGQYAWSLRDITSGNSVIARGVLSVQNAASND